MKSKIILFILLLSMMVNGASATYTISYDAYIEINNEQDVTLSDIYSAMGASKINETSPGVWECKYGIYLKGGTNLILSSSEIETLKIAGNLGAKQFLTDTGTSTVINGITIRAWNFTSDSQMYPTDNSILKSCTIKNTTWIGCGKPQFMFMPNNTVVENCEFVQGVSTNYGISFFGDGTTSNTPVYYSTNATFLNITTDGKGLYVSAIDGIVAHDLHYNYSSITVHNGNSDVIYLDACNNFTIYDIEEGYPQITIRGITLKGCSFGEIYDVNVNGDWSGTNQGGSGIYLIDNGRISGRGVKNVTIHDCTITNSSYGGLQIKGESTPADADSTDNITAYNITVSGGWHNGVDTNADTIILYNITCGEYHDGDGQPFYLQANNGSYIHDITSSGKGIGITASKNTIYQNITQTDAISTGQQMGFFNQRNCSLINYTRGTQLSNTSMVISISNPGTIIYPEYQSEDIRFIDTDFTPWNATTYDLYFQNTNFQAHLINVKGNYYISRGTGRYVRNYYYPNIIVLNAAGSPVQGAVVTLNTSAKNGWGYNQTSFYTDSAGKLYDSGNRSNWLAVMDFEDSDSVHQISSLITVSKDGMSDTVVVNPDNTWYSDDVSTLNSTTLTLTLAPFNSMHEGYWYTYDFDNSDWEYTNTTPENNNDYIGDIFEVTLE